MNHKPASDTQIKLAQYASGYSVGNDPRHLEQKPSGQYADWWSQGKADAQEERSRLIPRPDHAGGIIAPVRAMYLENTRSTDEDRALCQRIREIAADLDPKRNASERYSDMMKAAELLMNEKHTTLTAADHEAIRDTVTSVMAETLGFESVAEMRSTLTGLGKAAKADAKDTNAPTS